MDVIFTVPPPSISGLTPVGGPVTTQITVTGTGFQANQRDSTITINGTPATVLNWNNTQIDLPPVFGPVITTLLPVSVRPAA
ncbi:MAG: IPT/TIG domain-containing protein [Acidobacteriales bacterium]|nr:IPT/TIG domain-containing protein [Terriglobales bacterium]